MTNSSAHDQAVSDQQEQTDPMSHDGFEQPKENELSNIFKPAPHKEAAPNPQRVSPFDAQLTGEQVVPKQQAVAKPVQPKLQVVQQNRLPRRKWFKPNPLR